MALMSPSFFRNRNKFERWNHAALRMLPAQEGFAAGDGSRLQIDERLIMEFELVIGYC